MLNQRSFVRTCVEYSCKSYVRLTLFPHPSNIDPRARQAIRDRVAKDQQQGRGGACCAQYWQRTFCHARGIPLPPELGLVLVFVVVVIVCRYRRLRRIPNRSYLATQTFIVCRFSSNTHYAVDSAMSCYLTEKSILPKWGLPSSV